jgi:nucleoside-diphosphate-sugar epimerase
MTVLVTGATGFLGSALVPELLNHQQSVHIFVRDEKKAHQQFGNTVTISRGDITDELHLQRVVKGCTTIYHLAGRLYHPSIPEEVYRNTHVEGTRALMKACQGQSQIQRIVYVSTTGVYGNTGDTPAGEDASFAPTNSYEITKLEGEQLALKAYREQGLPVTVVRPGLVYGPGDLHLLDFFISINKGLFHVIDGGRSLLHPVYIDDLVAALLLCAAQSKSYGRSYNIAGERPVTVRELATTIAHALGRELPAGSIPLWLANLASDIFAVVPWIDDEHAPLTRSRIKFLTNNRSYDISRARSELGYIPRIGLEAGMKLTVAWYYKHRYIGNSSSSGRTV